jgi:hypothetical protein
MNKWTKILSWIVLAASYGAASAASTSLKQGDVMPTLSGETLSARPMQLPMAGTGTPRVLVFSFSREAGNDSRLWTEHPAKDPGAPGAVVVFRVILLHSVPRLFRGAAVSGIKSSVPQSLWDRTILTFRDEGLWKQYLAVSNEKCSYLLLVDGDNRVRWLSSGPYADAGYGELRKELDRPGNFGIK